MCNLQALQSFKRFVIFSMLIFPASLYADWLLQPQQSAIGFITYKNNNIAENSSFTGFQGSIDANATARILIDANSVNSNIALRDQRIRDLLLETQIFPAMYFTLPLSQQQLSSLKIGEEKRLTVTGELEMHSQKRPVTIEVLASKPDADTLWVSSLKPIIIKTEDYTLDAAVEALKVLANLTGISNQIPVSFVAVFKQQGDAESLSKQFYPSPEAATGLNISDNGGQLQASWSGPSINQNHYYLQYRAKGKSWRSAGIVAGFEHQFSFMPEVTGELEARVFHLYKGRASRASNTESFNYQGSGSGETKPETSESLWQTKGCISCHGADGDTGISVIASLENVNLVNIIRDSMPQGNAENCDQDCAVSIASWMKNNFVSGDKEPDLEPELEPVIHDELFLHWAFNGSGDTIIDRSGNGHDIALPDGSKRTNYKGRNNVLWVYDPELTFGTEALDVDTSKPFSVSFWLNTRSNPKSTSHYISADDDTFWFMIDAKEGLSRVSVAMQDNKRITRNDNIQIQHGDWNHYTITSNAGTGTLYINGKKILSREMTPRAGGFPYFKISRMNAYLDEVRIHQQNLDQKEVTAQYEYDVANHKDGQFNTGIVVADVEPLPGTKLPQRLQAGEAIYAQECASCHGVNGTGGSSPSLLQCDSCTTLETLSSRISSTMPTYAPLVCQDDCAVEVGRYVLEVLNASTHGEDTRPDEELELSDTQWLRTLYKTTLNLAGRLPHPLEVDMVKDWGETGLDNVMTSLMQEQAFYDRIGEIYNDVFHTDQRANKSVFFVNYFIPGVTEYWADKLTIDNIAKNWARNSTGFGFGREALNLIKYVVKNNRPFTEILTADYAVVNYYTARGYGLDADSMNFRRVPANEIHLEAEIYARKGSEMGDYNFDPRDLKPVKMPELYHGEHAGVLTTPSWIERHPSSATNLNRHRSYMFYKQFLDTDILAIAGMRVDLADEIASAEPTLNNPVCTSCHTIMDPVASTFQWWGNDLVRRVAEDKNRWNQNKILPPGFNGVDMPSNYANTPLVWLAQQAVIDARFARSVAKTLFEGVTGIVPLTEPGADASDELWSAYNTQKNFFKDLANTLRDNGHQIRPIIMAIVKSPYYRDKGHARLLTPEMLDRKLQASTGFSWTDRGYDNRKKLNKFYGGYTTLYGGIDDRRKITDRITDPSSSMTAVQRLMAAEHSCRAISNDFARKKASNRYLMNNVSHTQLPSESAVRSTLVSMQWKLFGDVVKSNDAIIDRYHQLFNSLQSGGVVAINNGDIDERLIGDCRAKIDPDTQQTLDTHVDDDRQFIIRAWMGVLQAMLLDYRFLYE